MSVDGVALIVGNAVTVKPYQSGTFTLGSVARCDGDDQHASALLAVRRMGDKKNQLLELRLRRKVVDEISVDPRVVAIDSPREATASDAAFQVTVFSKEPESPGLEPILTNLPFGLAVKSVRATTLNEPEHGLFKSAWRIACNFSAPADQGGSDPMTAQVIFQNPNNGLSLQASVLFSLVSTTGIDHLSRVECGALAVGEAVTRRIYLRARDGVAFQVTGCESDSGIKARPVSGKPQIVHWVDLELQAARPGDAEYKATLTTSHPSVPRLSLVLIAHAR